jgi:hypothetical protein
LLLDNDLDERRNNQNPEPGQGRGDVANAHRLVLQGSSKRQAGCLLTFDEESLMVYVFVAVQE